MSSPLVPILDQRLVQHLQQIDLSTFSRVDGARLAAKSVPNIGTIELVTGDVFNTVYDKLYISMFPKRAERERPDLIVERRKKEFFHQREGLARYRIVGIRDSAGSAIGAAHFSVLPLPGGSFAVPYLQYIYVRHENRRQDMSEVLHTLVLAVAAADVLAEQRVVPFTLFETDPPGHGHDVDSRAYAHERAQIHTKSGAVAMMVRKHGGEMLASPHVQPGLEDEDPPLSLAWVIRPSPALRHQFDIKTIGQGLVAAYYQSLRDEGFPEANIQLAERIVDERCRDAEFVLVPLSDIATTAH